MSGVLEQEALVPGRKTLVHIGFAHTVTCHGMRAGTVLFEKYGARIFQVCLHQNHPCREGQSPLTSFLESQRRLPVASTGDLLAPVRLL